MAGSLSWRQRGVVLSVLWLIGGGLLGWGLGTHQSDWIVKQYGVCRTAINLDTCYEGCGSDANASACQAKCNARSEQAQEQCKREFDKRRARPWWEHVLAMEAIVVLVPIILGWLIAWIWIRVERWVMRGGSGQST
jgi:hypothetical protein